MAFSSLRIFQPYTGAAAGEVNGSGNGSTNRVAVWSNGTTITSYSGLAFDGTKLAVTSASVQIDPAGLGNPFFLLGSNTGIGARFGVNTAGILTDTTVYGLYVDPQYPSTTTVQASSIVGAIKTAAAAFTVPIATTFFAEAPNKGAGSTITRMVHMYAALPSVGTNNAIYADNTSFSGNWGFHLTSATQNLIAGSLVIGTAALSTSATDGFLYLPTCAGTPTGVPTSRTGQSAVVYDTTNNKIAVYNGGAWKQTAALT